MSETADLSQALFKKKCIEWLAEGRTHEEIADKMQELFDAAVEGTLEHHNLKVKQAQLKMQEALVAEILKPIPVYDPGPWWKLW